MLELVNNNNMPLRKGAGFLKKNMQELMSEDVGSSRKKAIATLAKKHGISREEAKKRQAFAIAKSQLSK